MRFKTNMILLVAILFGTAGVAIAQDVDPVEKAPKTELQQPKFTAADVHINCELTAQTTCDIANFTTQTTVAIETAPTIHLVAELPSVQVVDSPLSYSPQSLYIPVKPLNISRCIPTINGPPKA